ncbi:hypothetical protein CW304_09925 [Bacillus sp. UFRGS-B20]|nr:hypothetical protein CW304_09925 [Bacillus sp. UFRGS-B20]
MLSRQQPLPPTGLTASHLEISAYAPCASKKISTRSICRNISTTSFILFQVTATNALNNAELYID